ncbi:SCO family protein [Pseudalkalibacillus sp. Hm43]|uniref:SCO family protein n=1 Tax=Pseudalkalibacillus sp. Hm43 TaxID=3450742 RepID=UPI003F436564
MKKILSILSILFVLTLLSACGQNMDKPDDYDFEVQSFTYTNQDGESVSLEDLKGKVWIADFIFTNCETVCPPMTNHMASLQENMKKEGLENVEIVSFSVDPGVDSPEVLKEFGQKFDADFSNWHFLTGYEQSEIEAFAKDSFKTIVQKPKDDDQVTHGTAFYLVDQEGIVRTRYDGVNRSNEDDEEVINDIKALQQ